MQQRAMVIVSLLGHGAIALILLLQNPEQAGRNSPHQSLFFAAQIFTKEQGPSAKPLASLPSLRKRKSKSAANHVDPDLNSDDRAGSDGSAGNDIGVLARDVRMEPCLLNPDIKIPYPKRAKQLRIEGIVRLRLTISAEGRVLAAEVLSGPFFGLREAALKVAHDLNFLPATNQVGEPILAKVEHEVVFRLNKTS